MFVLRMCGGNEPIYTRMKCLFGRDGEIYYRCIRRAANYFKYLSSKRCVRQASSLRHSFHSYMNRFYWWYLCCGVFYVRWSRIRNTDRISMTIFPTFLHRFLLLLKYYKSCHYEYICIWFYERSMLTVIYLKSRYYGFCDCRWYIRRPNAVFYLFARILHR